MIINSKPKYRTDEKVLIKCDFGTSPKCKGTFYKVFKNVLKCQANNNGKDMCCFCFNTLTKTGKNNYNYKYSKNEDYFHTIDTELKAYLLGWVAGDGCIKKDGLQLEIHKDDIEILHLFKIALSSNAPIRKHSVHNTVKLIINSVYIVKDLLHHLNLNKAGKKFDKITLPNIPDELQWHFIRGLVDSDGSVSNPYKCTYPRISYCSMSSKIKEQILDFCKKYTIFARQSKYSIHWSGHDCLNLIAKIYGAANFFLKRKKKFADIHKTWVYREGNIVKPFKSKSIRSDDTHKLPPKRLTKILLLNKSKRKLSEQDVFTIKKMYDDGRTQKEISILFNVSQMTISNIITGKMYKEEKCIHSVFM